jgi:hypothetical protein
MVAAAGVLVGVVYYIMDMRNQIRIRQTDLVMRLYDRFSGTEFQDAWARVRTEATDFKNIDDLYDVDKKSRTSRGQPSLSVLRGNRDSTPKKAVRRSYG